MEVSRTRNSSGWCCMTHNESAAPWTPIKIMSQKSSEDFSYVPIHCAKLPPYLAGSARSAAVQPGTLPTFLLAGSWMEEMRAHLRCAGSPLQRPPHLRGEEK